MTQNQTHQPEMTSEQRELWENFQQTLVTFPKELKRMKDACQFSLADAKGPLAFVSQKLAEVQQSRKALEKQKAAPDYAYAETQLRIAERMFAASKRMLEIQGEYDRQNLALAEQGLEIVGTAGEDPNAWVRLDQGGLLSAIKFKQAEEDVAFLESRAQINLYFGLHHWMNCLDGIDAILRATGGPKAIVCQTPQEEAGRDKLAQIFKEAMAADRDVAMQVGQWGTELTETIAYFDWAAPLLRGLEGKPEAAKKAVLVDADWQKLNGKVVLLATLPERVQAFPALAPYFPAPELPEVPYQQLEWRDPDAPVGTGRLQAGTGRLPSGTGRLQGQTGRLKA